MTEKELNERAYRAAQASMPRVWGYGASGATKWAMEMREGCARRNDAERRLESVESLVKVGGDW